MALKGSFRLETVITSFWDLLATPFGDTMGISCVALPPASAFRHWHGRAVGGAPSQTPKDMRARRRYENYEMLHLRISKALSADFSLHKARDVSRSDWKSDSGRLVSRSPGA